jgi:hypothetical protein
MARTGRPPTPVERKRALGNPGKRPLPATQNVVEILAAVEIPDPPRPLGPAGTDLWQRSWRTARHWLSAETDLELLLMVAEQVDERVGLRIQVVRHGDKDDRKALRDLDKQVVANLSLLGFTPVDRTRLGLAEVKRASKLDTLIASRQQA